MNRLYMTANIIFILLLAAGFIVMPPFADDLWYYQDIYAARQNGTSAVSAAFDTIKYHYMYDNGRLANIVFSMSLILPRWIGSLLGAIAFGGALFIAYRLIEDFSHRRIGFLTAISMISLSGLALPWYDYLYQQCYQFNYLMSTGFSMWAVFLVLSSAKLKKGHFPLIASFLTGIFAGGWHEGFGVPVFVGIIALGICRNEYRNLFVGNILAGMAIGITWVFTSPAAFERMGNSGSSLSQFVTVMALHPVFMLLGIICIVLILKRKYSRIMHSPLFILLGVSVLISFVIHLASVRAPRAGWWCEFASIILIGYITAVCVTHVSKLLRVAGIGLIAVTFVKLTVNDIYAWRYRAQYPRLVSEYRSSSNGVVFLDFIPEYASPIIAWMAPSFHLYYDRYQRWMFAECYGDETKQPVIIPAELKNVVWNDGRPIDGNFPVRQFGNFYLCRQEDFKGINDDAMATDGEFDGRMKVGPVLLNSVRVFYYFFENDHGEKLVLLIPWRIFPLSSLFDIQSISLK